MIPHNWIECPWFSKESILDLFVASKTFLDETYNDVLPEDFRYQPSYLLEMEKHFNKKIGMVIDLNNSRRFYNPRDVESLGRKYCKIACEGYQAAPTKQQVDKFIGQCKRQEESSPNDLILVHCTHGFNRTGFMIISYLVEERMMDLKTCVDCFSEARSPGIYKQNYMDELIKMFHCNDSIVAELKPRWTTKAILQTYSKSSNNITNQINQTNINGSFNDETVSENQDKSTPETTTQFCINGLNVFPASKEKTLKVKARLKEMFPTSGDGFPGSQPVSMDANNVEFIQTQEYSISWKADGTRYLMYIMGENEVFMIDRDFNIFKIPSLIFPRDPKNPGNDSEDGKTITHTFDTLVDGEMVLEYVNKTTYYPRFMIYDVIMINGLYVGNENFWKRYHFIRVDLIGPRDFYLQNGIYDRNKQTFSVRRKQFYELKHSEYLIKEIIPNITHLTDGIIFQPVNDPYTPGTCPMILKWKPPHLNTIDFKLMIATVKEPGCLIEKKVYLYLSGSSQSSAEIKYSDPINHLNNKIVECNLINGGWNIIRVREDKSFANSVTTAKAVMESIYNPVTEKDLYQILNIK